MNYNVVGNEYIAAGTPVYVDPTARTAEICKSVLGIDGGGSTTPRVTKGHHFKVGDILNDGTTGAYITTITQSATGYDVFTVNTAVQYSGSIQYIEGSATGSSTALKYTPNGVIKSPTRIYEGNADVPVVTIGTLRSAALTYPIPSLYAIPLRGGTAGTGKSLITVM
jgi:hypothetical protein